MEDLPLGRIAALVPEFAVKDLPLGSTMMLVMMMKLRSMDTIKVSMIVSEKKTEE